MKLKLLSSAIIFGAMSSVYGQMIFSSTNEPEVGDGRSMIKIEVNDQDQFDNLTQMHITGSVWDYSGVNFTTNTSAMAVGTASSHASGSEFPQATKFIQSGNVTTFLSSSAASRVARGFVYSELLGADPVVLKLNGNGQTMMNYPFAVGNITTNIIDGSVDMTSPLPISVNFTGNGTVSHIVDNGTILLPNNTSITGVTKVTYIDSCGGDIPLMGEGSLKRKIVEYFVPAQGGLPIMTETFIGLYTSSPTTPAFSSFGIELDEGYLAYASVTAANLINLSLAPNPSNGTFTINGDFEKGLVTVVDVNGKQILSENVNAGKAITINAGAGVYFVSVATENGAHVQKMVIH